MNLGKSPKVVRLGNTTIKEWMCMDNERIEVTNINAYELQERFDERESKQLKKLKKAITEQYQGDGEYQASDDADEVLEGDSAAEMSGEFGKSGQEKPD